jgi:hypothetical protein
MKSGRATPNWDTASEEPLRKQAESKIQNLGSADEKRRKRKPGMQAADRMEPKESHKTPRTEKPRSPQRRTKITIRNFDPGRDHRKPLPVANVEGIDMRTNMNDWMHERLEHYRAVTPHPGTTCWYCGGLAEWREVNESGRPTPGTEWCFCSACGQRLRGEVSPWSEKASSDWKATPHMQRMRIKWRSQAARKRVKFGCSLGRRHVLADTTGQF